MSCEIFSGHENLTAVRGRKAGNNPLFPLKIVCRECTLRLTRRAARVLAKAASAGPGPAILRRGRSAGTIQVAS